MSDELRAAAERIISGTEEVDHLLSTATLVAEAYLAEHPADDDEPADDDWQMSIGLSEDRVMVEWDGTRGDVITWIDGIDLSSANPPWNTRRDVRRLLAALGIDVTK